nr:histidine kinase [uncultured Acetatifactor sp.]
MRKWLVNAKTKMLFLYFFSLLFLYTITGVILDIFLFRPLREERNQYISDYAHQISSGVLNQKEVYEKIVLQICNNQVVVENLSERHEEPIEIWESMNDISQIIRSNREIMPSIHKLAVYVQGSSLWTDGNCIFTQELLVRDFDANCQWFAESENGLQMYSICSEMNGLYNSVQAYVKLSVNVQKAFGDYIYFDNGIDGRAYLVDQNGIVIASSQPVAEGKRPEQFVNGIKGKISKGNILEVNGDVVLWQQIDDEWSVIVALPAAYTKKKMQSTYIIIGVIMLGLAFVTGVTMFRMIGKWYDALEEVTAIRIQKQKFEVRSLELQVNPHFLYNTLGAMRWEALDCRSRKLVGMIDNLTTFYRRSLNKGNSFLTVIQEVDLVKAYIAIQEERCNHCVKVQIEVDKEVESVIVPKMILQPLVENIWIHGNITKSGSQYIGISAHKLSEGYLQILVVDNGSGISEERLKQIKNSEDENGSGIGLSYIENILQFYYKDNYVFDIRSKEGEWTRVSLILPDRFKEETNYDGEG